MGLFKPILCALFEIFDYDGVRHMKKIIFICLSLILLIATVYLFFGSRLHYFFSYNKNNFPYKICEEGNVCEVKIGEVFAHEWFSNEKNCISPVFAGYGYRIVKAI